MVEKRAAKRKELDSNFKSFKKGEKEFLIAMGLATEDDFAEKEDAPEH